MDCSTARALIPRLVDAEAAGLNADDMPEFAALLRHLDTCESCTEEYNRQSEA